MSGETFELRVDPGSAGSRLDVFLAGQLPGASRAAAKRLIADGQVSVDGRRAPKGRTVDEGQVVVVEGYLAPGSWGPEPDRNLHLSVIYEDDDMVVVDKPPGVPCHPLRPGELGTAAGALLARYPDLGDAGDARREAGLVHRLDTTTSGVLVAARNRRAFAHLRAELRGGRATKRYVTLVEGAFTGPMSIELPLENRGKRSVPQREGHAGRSRSAGRPAVTAIHDVREIAPFSLLEVSLHAGRHHQIRAHLAAVGHPVAGDELYGASLEAGLDRPFLHASEIELTLPSPGGAKTLRAELAADLVACLGRLGGGRVP